MRLGPLLAWALGRRTWRPTPRAGTESDDENLWTNKEFLIFVINHPSLLSFADKQKWYDLIDQLISQLRLDQLTDLRNLFHDPIWDGWADYVMNVPGMNHTYMHNAFFDIERQTFVSLCTRDVDQAFLLSQNFLKHPPYGVRFPCFYFSTFFFFLVWLFEYAYLNWFWFLCRCHYKYLKLLCLICWTTCWLCLSWFYL